jgi:hypothetical protein
MNRIGKQRHHQARLTVRSIEQQTKGIGSNSSTLATTKRCGRRPAGRESKSEPGRPVRRLREPPVANEEPPCSPPERTPTVTDTTNPPTEAHPQGRLSALAALFGADGPPDLEEITGPFHWGDLTPREAATAWPELRSWVEDLVARFSSLDHHVIPACWWQHNSHVEALAALRDHERISYAETATATAAVEWLRALRDVTAMLHDWTGQQACATTHIGRDRQLRPPTPDEWERFVVADVERRRDHAVETALADEEVSR